MFMTPLIPAEHAVLAGIFLPFPPPGNAITYRVSRWSKNVCARDHFLRILQNSEVKKHKVFLKIKKDFTPSNANK